jgi:hypothetical protein
MSTRACIAYTTPRKKHVEWEGVYSHWDGYPSGVGAVIWEILHGDFIGNEGRLGVKNDGKLKTALQGFIDIYIKGHPAGWSSLVESICYCHDPAFVMRDGRTTNKIDSPHPDPLFIEYVYIIDPEKGTMSILSSEYQPDYQKGSAKKQPVLNAKGYWDYGSCAYRHKILTTIDLSKSEEPDWKTLDAISRGKARRQNNKAASK